MLESLKKRKASSDDANDSREMAMTVGRYLKTERESQGQDLPQVAEMLRIHRSYLQAIEEGEIDQLPGPTYAVGFVRAYAEYLGLDRNNVAERFKEESKITKQHAQLILPSPLPEGQIPSLAVLLIAAVLLSVARKKQIELVIPESGKRARRRNNPLKGSKIRAPLLNPCNSEAQMRPRISKHH